MKRLFFVNKLHLEGSQESFSYGKILMMIKYNGTGDDYIEK